MRHPFPLLRAAVIATSTAVLLAPTLPIEAFAKEPASALTEANAVARSVYAENRASRLDASGPVIVVAFDDLVLFRGAKQVARQGFTDPIYHRLKEIAHIPLGVATTATAALDIKGDRSWREEFVRLSAATEAALAGLSDVGFSDAQKTRQTQILERSLAYMAGALRRDTVLRRELESFAAVVTPPVMENSREAAAVQLDGLHALFETWRKTHLADDQIADLRVMVLGAKMPRPGNLQFEYFVRVMGDDAVGRRLVYAEGIFDPDGAMRLLGTILQDRAVATLMFGEPLRLDRDLLADDAADQLKEIFGR